jgi:hypothetical protein
LWRIALQNPASGKKGKKGEGGTFQPFLSHVARVGKSQ